MKREEAKEHQEQLSKHYNLGWWYGTKCEKCCDVYPKLMIGQTMDKADCWYECEVCGKRTRRYTMPWIAEEAWNRHEYIDQQLSLI